MSIQKPDEVKWISQSENVNKLMKNKIISSVDI